MARSSDAQRLTCASAADPDVHVDEHDPEHDPEHEYEYEYEYDDDDDDNSARQDQWLLRAA